MSSIGVLYQFELKFGNSILKWVYSTITIYFYDWALHNMFNISKIKYNKICSAFTNYRIEFTFKEYSSISLYIFFNPPLSVCGILLSVTSHPDPYKDFAKSRSAILCTSEFFTKTLPTTCRDCSKLKLCYRFATRESHLRYEPILCPLIDYWKCRLVYMKE